MENFRLNYENYMPFREPKEDVTTTKFDYLKWYITLYNSVIDAVADNDSLKEKDNKETANRLFKNLDLVYSRAQMVTYSPVIAFQ